MIKIRIKIDLMVGNGRGDSLFLQASELDILKKDMAEHGINGGLKQLMELADNVDAIFRRIQEEDGIRPDACAYWGDEYVGIEDGIFGSDSFMHTQITEAGDFFDVSDIKSASRPGWVKVVGGGTGSFLEFLQEQQSGTGEI